MRIPNPTALATVVRDTRGTAARAAGPRRDRRRTLRRRLNAYTLWAFNPQRELTSRYDRAA